MQASSMPMQTLQRERGDPEKQRPPLASPLRGFLCPSPRKGLGFSLVEFMIVVAIMGILSAMAVVFSRENVDRQAVTQMRTRIARFMSEARGIAIARGLPVAVYLDPARGTLTSFLWADTLLNQNLDWTDTNANGLLDNGEGEVMEVYGRIQVTTGREEGAWGKRFRFLTVPYPQDPAPQSVGCSQTAGSPEPRLMVFMPTGAILNSAGFLCGEYVLYLQHEQYPEYTSKIRVRTSGYVESYDLFG